MKRKNNPRLRIMNEVNTLLIGGESNLPVIIEILETEADEDIRQLYYSRPFIREYLEKRNQQNGR